jgi:hypothetical protein
MALRDYYRCKKCDAKIVYGPDRTEDQWEPFLLCPSCMAAVEQQLQSQQGEIERLKEERCDLKCSLSTAECQRDFARAKCDRMTGLLEHIESFLETCEWNDPTSERDAGNLLQRIVIALAKTDTEVSQ